MYVCTMYGILDCSYTNGIAAYVEKVKGLLFQCTNQKRIEFSNNDEKVMLSNVPLIQQLPE